MAVTLVQTNLGPGNGGASTATAGFSVPSTAGNIIAIAVIELLSTGGGLPPQVVTCTDDASGSSNLYTNLKTSYRTNFGNQANMASQFLYCIGARAASNITIGWGGGGVSCQILIYELTQGVMYDTRTNVSSSSNAPDSGSFVPLGNGAFIIGCGVINDNHGSSSWCSAGTNFTLTGQNGTTGGGFNSSWAYEHWQQTSIASADATYTSLNPTFVGPSAASMIIFGPSIGSGISTGPFGLVNEATQINRRGTRV